MRSLTVGLGGRSYPILIERGILSAAGDHIRAACPRAERLAVVTDSTVGPLYAHRAEEALTGAGFETRRYQVPAGEASKSPEMLSRLWEEFMSFGLTRTDAVVALGGGVVGDLAGFAAATALRGVDFIQLPTTLLAQVDSSVGGKVAVDLRHGKNLAGAFHQPRAVLMDPAVLGTLDDAAFADGMAEVIKYGCIADPEFFSFLERHPSRREVMDEIEHVLYTCCDLKRRVVEADERDTGARMVLNFGHTLGHAYELAGHYDTWTHGQAVAAGMVKALELGEALGVTPGGLRERVAVLLGCFGLPVHIPAAPEDYAAAVRLDKKGTGGDITLILLDRLGHAVPHRLGKAALLEALA